MYTFFALVTLIFPVSSSRTLVVVLAALPLHARSIAASWCYCSKPIEGLTSLTEYTADCRFASQTLGRKKLGRKQY